MRLRLLLRRLTVSAPRMSVRSALPWPLRWALLAIVFGFCAAIALWAFEFGKEIAGLERGSKGSLQRARAEVLSLQASMAMLTAQRDQAQLIANTADTLLTSERVVQQGLLTQIRQLEAENRTLRADLGFFEKLIPSSGTSGIAIRGLQAELRDGRELRWQVLVIQAGKNAPEFSGHLELRFTGVRNGKPWSAALPGGPQPFTLKQYGRMEGVFELPAQAVVKGVAAKVLEGSATKAEQSIKL